VKVAREEAQLQGVSEPLFEPKGNCCQMKSPPSPPNHIPAVLLQVLALPWDLNILLGDIGEHSLVRVGM
jgi:hypothetical protein